MGTRAKSSKQFRNLKLIKRLRSIKTLLPKLIPKFKQRTKGEDLFDRDVFAENIVNQLIANHRKSDDGYVFAVSGKWGEGKTRLLVLVEEKLLQNNFQVVWFNPWQYTQDSETLRRTFLKALQKQLSEFKLRDFYTFSGFLNLFQKIRIKFISLKRLEREETGTSINYSLLGRILFIAIFFCVVVIIFAGLNQLVALATYANIVYTQYQSVALIILGLSALVITPNLVQIEHTSSKINAVDDFELLFQKCLNYSNKRVVVFIDDLDRCTPAGIKLVLDTLKTFFRTKDAMYIVTGDHSVIESSIGGELNITPVYKNDNSGLQDIEATGILEKLEGKRFLQKLFNVYWKLPQLEPAEAKKFTSEKMKAVTLISDQDKPPIIDLINNSVENNLREIERFVSLLNFSLKTIQSRIDFLKNSDLMNGVPIKKIMLANLNEVINNPGLLTKILIMQEKFDSEYYYFSKQPKVFYQFEITAINNDESTETMKSMGRLKGRFSDFISVVKHKPTFYSPQNFSVSHAPEKFFYYSGFSDESDFGLLAEGFISRYVTNDNSLIDDLKKSSSPQIIEVVSTGIENLKNISDSITYTIAIRNLVKILVDEELNLHELFIPFLTTSRVIEYFKSINETAQKEFLEPLLHVIFKYNDFEVLSKLFKNDPWLSRKDIYWDYLDPFPVKEEILNIFLEDIVNNTSGLPNVDERVKNIIRSHTHVWEKADVFSLEDMKSALERFETVLRQLNPQNHVDIDVYKRIFEQFKKDISIEKRKLLGKILLADYYLWQNIGKPKEIFGYMNSSSKLMKSPVKAESQAILKSWKIR